MRTNLRPRPASAEVLLQERQHRDRACCPSRGCASAARAGRRAAGRGRARTRRAGSSRASAPGAAGAGRPARRAATPSASRSATSRIRPDSACIFSPWKAGSISLRCSRWASPSSRITEFWPTTGSSMRAPSPGCRTSGGAVKTCFTSVRVGEHHEHGARREPDREALAVAGAVALEEGDRAHPPAHRLEQARRPRAGWQAEVGASAAT